jgi:hypothetical protein
MKIILTIFLLTFTINVKADSWIDPSWKEMLDSSDVIALIQYTSNGDFRAKAKILNIYKGQLKVGDEIFISGFSNRYGPIDKVHKGDKYLVFINLSQLTDTRLEYWNEELVKKPELKEFVEAYKDQKAYYVWSPTSGDLKVKGKKIQYDLIQTTIYDEQKYYSLTEFEIFLNSYRDKSQRIVFCNELLNKIKPATESELNSQFLVKLYLLNYSVYDNVFAEYVKVENPSSKFALAQLMGNIKNEQSRQILISLLDDKHSLVQGEAVRQLANEPVEFVGPILLKHLNNASSYNSAPSNIMNPVMNTIDGGKSQIIQTLGSIGYRPAIQALLPLLDTKDDDDFRLIVETLRKLGSKEYASYINKHLESLDDKMVLQLCFIIRDDSLTECIPSLMKYVKTHDRTVWPTKECTISKYFGLAHFKTDTIKNFLYADFLDLMKMPNTNYKSIDTKQKWVNEYLIAFNELKIGKAKPYIYDYMFDYYGFDLSFKNQPKMFEYKKQFEDSLINITKLVLKEKDIKEIQAVAFIKLENDKPKLVDYSVKFISNNGELDILTNKLIEKGISKEHIIASSGNYTQTNGAKDIERFGDSFMDNFLEYVSSFSDKNDFEFITNLKKYNYAKTDYEIEKLDKYLINSETNLGQ